MSSIRTISGFALGPILAGALGLATFPLIAWVFDPAEVGRLSLFQLLASLSVLVLTLGLDQSFIREFHSSTSRSSLLLTCASLGAFACLISTIPVYFFQKQLDHLLFGVRGGTGSLILIGTVMCLFVSRYLSLILRMEERGIAFSLSQILPKLVMLLMIALIPLFALPRTFTLLALTSLLSAASVMALYLVTTRRYWTRFTGIDIGQWPGLLAYGLPLMISGLAYWALTATSAFGLRFWSSFHQVGIYAVASSAAGVAALVQNILTTVWTPVVYRWNANHADMSRIVNIAKYSTAAICALTCVVGSSSWVIQWVLPGAYGSIEPLAAATMIPALLYTLSEITSIGINLSKRTSFALISTTTALGINVALSAVLIPNFGARGAVSANAVAFLALFLVRTEAASIVWIPLPRGRIYATVVPLSIGASVVALVGPIGGMVVSLAWAAGLVATILWWRVELLFLFASSKAFAAHRLGSLSNRRRAGARSL